MHYGPSEGEKLSLTVGKKIVTHHGIEAALLFEGLAEINGCKCFQEFFVGLIPSYVKVVSDRSVEKERVLGKCDESRPHILPWDGAEIDSIHRDLPFCKSISLNREATSELFPLPGSR